MTPYELGQNTALVKLGIRNILRVLPEEAPQLAERMLARDIPGQLSRSAVEAGKQTAKKKTQQELARMRFMPGMHGM